MTTDPLNDGCIQLDDAPEASTLEMRQIAHDAIISPRSLAPSQVMALGYGYAVLAADVARLTADLERAEENYATAASANREMAGEITRLRRHQGTGAS